MKMRTFLAYMHLSNFLIGFLGTSYVLNILWNSFEFWQIILYTYYLVLCLCGVVLSSWIGIDAKNIEHCTVEIQELEMRILDLEKKINRIRLIEVK